MRQTQGGKRTLSSSHSCSETKNMVLTCLSLLDMAGGELNKHLGFRATRLDLTSHMNHKTRGSAHPYRPNQRRFCAMYLLWSSIYRVRRSAGGCSTLACLFGSLFSSRSRHAPHHVRSRWQQSCCLAHSRRRISQWRRENVRCRHHVAAARCGAFEPVAGQALPCQAG